MRRIHGSARPLLWCLSACLVVSLVGIANLPTCAQDQTAQALSTSDKPDAPQDQRRLAQQYIASRDYDKAIECLTSILAGNPVDATSLKADLGLCYKFKRDYAKAMPLFAEAGAASGPRQTKALFWIEDCYCEQGKFAEAVDYLTGMYSGHPELRDQILGRRSARFKELGRYKEALADLKEFIASYPDSKLVNISKMTLADLMFKVQGNTSESVSALNEAFSIAFSESVPRKPSRSNTNWPASAQTPGNGTGPYRSTRH